MTLQHTTYHITLNRLQTSNGSGKGNDGRLQIFFTTKKLKIKFHREAVAEKVRPGIPIPFRFRTILRSETEFRSFSDLCENLFPIQLSFPRFYLIPIPRSELRNQTNSESETELKINSF